jgi:hypothetical protein
MTSNLMLYTEVVGSRLIVLANRLSCDNAFSRTLYQRLIDGLDAAIDLVRTIMSLERQLFTYDEFTAFQLEGATEMCGIVVGGVMPLPAISYPFNVGMARPLRSRWGMSDRRPPHAVQLDRHPQRPARFLPLATTTPHDRSCGAPVRVHSSRNKKASARGRPPLRFGLFRCGPIAPGLIDSHRGRDGRGPSN